MTKGADNCAAFDALLVEYAYGELEGDARLQLESHLGGCEACRTALEAMGATRRTMRVLAPVPAPEAGLESLLDYARQAAARNAAPTRSRWRWRWRWLVPAMSAGSLGLALAVVLVSGRGPGEDVLPAAAPAAQARLCVEEKARPAALDELAKAQPAAPAPVAVSAAKDCAVGKTGAAFAGEVPEAAGLASVDRSAEPSVERLAEVARKPEKKTAGFAGEKRSRSDSATAREQQGVVAAARAQEPPSLCASGAAQKPAPPPPPAAMPSEQLRGGGGLARSVVSASPSDADGDARSEAAMAKGEATSDDYEAFADVAPRKSKQAARAATRAAEEAAEDSVSGLEAALASARAASARGDFALAASILARGLAANPNDPRAADALLELALAYERSGNPVRAEESYARFLARYPEDSRAGPAAASRARLSRQAGRARSAAEAADQALPAAPAGPSPQSPPAEP